MGSTPVTALAGPVIVMDIETSADSHLIPVCPSGNPMPTLSPVSYTVIPHSPYCLKKLKCH